MAQRTVEIIMGAEEVEKALAGQNGTDRDWGFPVGAKLHVERKGTNKRILCIEDYIERMPRVEKQLVVGLEGPTPERAWIKKGELEKTDVFPRWHDLVDKELVNEKFFQFEKKLHAAFGASAIASVLVGVRLATEPWWQVPTGASWPAEIGVPPAIVGIVGLATFAKLRQVVGGWIEDDREDCFYRLPIVRKRVLFNSLSGIVNEWLWENTRRQLKEKLGQGARFRK